MKKKIANIKTKYGVFPCVFETERDMGGYSAEARGVQGAVSWGKNLAEAKRMIAEAVEGVFEAHIIARAEQSGVVQINQRRIPSFV